MDLAEAHVPEGIARTEALIAAFDWSATSIGAMRDWPAHVKSTVRLLLDAALPTVTLWGTDGVTICNEAYRKLIGAEHPAWLGARALGAWPDAAALNQNALRAGLAGQTGIFYDHPIAVQRQGSVETIRLNLAYSPIRDETGTPAGVWAVAHETTDRARLERQRDIDRVKLDAADIRHRCLIKLGERLRRCETAAQISGAVSEILGEVLACARTGYAVVTGQHALIENDWNDGTVQSLSGQHQYSSLGQHYLSHIGRGEILAVPDVRVHPVTAESADRWSRIDVRALLNVPLLDNGTVVGLLYAHDQSPRAWTADEVSLMQEVADRTWEAMGRARAVEALRRMNDSLEAQVRERTVQRDRMWTLSTDIMMVTNLAGKIVAVNPAWTRLLGWQESELVNASFYDFIHPEDIAATQAERRKLEGGQMLRNFENRYRAKDGRSVWLSWRAVPDGDLIHSAARDVTAEREQADALQAAEEALRQAQKMEAVGQLTGGIAHDFNNLLQGILGSLELAERSIATGRPERLAHYHAQARRSAERASALTHRLLAFSRRQPLDPKPVQANDLLLGMEPLLRRTLGESIELKFDLAPDLWSTLCDPNQLDSAILNLTINARDAMPKGGTLVIRSVNLPDRGAGTESGKTGDSICVTVTDSGMGMPPDVVARAFDPFFTTKPIGQGTGLGLSMVYGFMRQSGGEAKISSTIGVGTTVALYLRRHVCEHPEQPAVALRAESADRIHGQGTVMVLEDEPAVRLVILDVLKQLGFQVIEAHDGPSGLEILRSPQPIDLLVTDIGLPGLNGREVAEAARRLRPGLKVLFMTAYAGTAGTQDGFLSPGMELITKPFTVERLTARVLQMTCA